jgi:putative transcriptional regulator
MSSKAPKSMDEVLLAGGTSSSVAREERALVDGGVAREEVEAAKAALATVGAALAPLPSPPPAALRARLAASFVRGGRYGAYADRIARLFDIELDTAAALLAKLDSPDKWKPWLDGVQMMPVKPGPKYAGAIAAFGRLRPGARFPHHEHVGDETTVVLDGGFRNEDGSEVWRGEELWRPAGTEHEFVVLEGVECIAAVISIGGVTFR